MGILGGYSPKIWQMKLSCLQINLKMHILKSGMNDSLFFIQQQ